jgi:5'-deoxynucleotidase YfbR-like HD superfamily hydrolase
MLELRSTAEFLRASHISRWGIVQTARPQNIAEHQYRVWLLVQQWATYAGLNIIEKRCASQLALIHDLPEIRTGDAPTPHKTPEVKAYLADVERQILPELHQLEQQASARVTAFIKFCDTAEAVLFLRINGLGKHAADVRDLLEQQMLDRLGQSAIDPACQQRLIECFISTKHDT